MATSPIAKSGVVSGAYVIVPSAKSREGHSMAGDESMFTVVTLTILVVETGSTRDYLF